jgi:hypothetical protein
MRGGIAPLALLAVGAALTMALAARGVLRTLLGVALLVALAGQAMEATILIHPPWEESPGCTLPEAAAQSVFQDSTDWSHYVVPWPEPALRHLLAPPDPRIIDPAAVARCWPDARG